MSRVRSRLAALVLVAGVLLGGCSTSLEPYLPEPVPVPVEELWERPSAEDAAAELETFLADVRSRLESELGLGGWTQITEVDRSGCGLNLGPDFDERSVPSWGSAGPVLRSA